MVATSNKNQKCIYVYLQASIIINLTGFLARNAWCELWMGTRAGNAIATERDREGWRKWKVKLLIQSEMLVPLFSSFPDISSECTHTHTYTRHLFYNIFLRGWCMSAERTSNCYAPISSVMKMPVYAFCLMISLNSTNSFRMPTAENAPLALFLSLATGNNKTRVMRRREGPNSLFEIENAFGATAIEEERDGIHIAGKHVFMSAI